MAQASGEVTLSDTVYYENLKTDGTEYTVTGTLMLKSTGEALVGADGNPVTAGKTFRPKQRSGEVELQFAFDGSLLAGEDVVAFESLVSGGVEVASMPTSMMRGRPFTSWASAPRRPTKRTATSSSPVSTSPSSTRSHTRD